MKIAAVQKKNVLKEYVTRRTAHAVMMDVFPNTELPIVLLLVIVLKKKFPVVKMRIQVHGYFIITILNL